MGGNDSGAIFMAASYEKPIAGKLYQLAPRMFILTS
jgi:hypothetical protein